MIHYKNLDNRYKKYFNVAVVNIENNIIEEIFIRYRNDEYVEEYEFKLLFKYIRDLFEELIKKYTTDFREQRFNNGFNYKYAIKTFGDLIKYIDKIIHN